VKNTCTAGVQSKGFCFYKCTNGIKRHLAVDVLGFPVFTLCTRANVTDDQGLIDMFIHNERYFIERPEFLTPLTVLLDSGYHTDFIIKALEDHPAILNKVTFEISPKMSKEMKKELGLKGFVPVFKRWIVERSNSWTEKCKSLIKNFEKTLERANYKLQLCFMRLMLKNIAKA